MNLDNHLLTAIRTQHRYPVIVLHKAVTAFLSAIVPVSGKPNCKTLDTQAKCVRINNRNHLVLSIDYKEKGIRRNTTISARVIAYFIARKRFPPEGMALACSCGYYHCIEFSHLFKELNGSNGSVKRNHKRNLRNEAVRTGGNSKQGYSVYTYSESHVITDPKDLPLWADETIIDVKATRVD